MKKPYFTIVTGSMLAINMIILVLMFIWGYKDCKEADILAKCFWTIGLAFGIACVFDGRSGKFETEVHDLTYDELEDLDTAIRSLVVLRNNQGKRPEIVKKLKSFGVDRISDLNNSQFKEMYNFLLRL